MIGSEKRRRERRRKKKKRKRDEKRENKIKKKKKRNDSTYESFFSLTLPTQVATSSKLEPLQSLRVQSDSEELDTMSGASPPEPIRKVRHDNIRLVPLGLHPIRRRPFPLFPTPPLDFERRGERSLCAGIGG